MKVVLHPDGGSGVGLGHASRCAALARALARGGHEVEVLVRADARLDDFFAKQALRAVHAPVDEAVAAADVVVIDSYRCSADEIAHLRRRGAVVAVFDDDATKRVVADMVINGAPGAERLRYAAGSSTRLLLGSRYQVVRDEFRELPFRGPGDAVSRLIVLAGGDDPLRVTPLLVAAIEPLHLQTDVICGPFSRELDVSSSHVAVVRDPPDLRDRMLTADIALSAAGQTLYELACCGTPTIAFATGGDQLYQLSALADAGVVVNTGSAATPTWLASVQQALQSLRRDPARRRSMSRLGRSLIDGRGADRVAEALEDLVRGRTATSKRA